MILDKEYFLNFNKELSNIIEKIADNDGIALVVGGAVRDYLLDNKIIKDLDIEVYNLDLNKLKNILAEFGKVNLVGKKFGVLRINRINIDWSLPRIDSSGRHPEVKIDKNLDYKVAFKRRDLTINAMGVNLNTGELIDLYNGEKDLKNKILKAVDEKLFLEDPLRFYRVMSFYGRLNMAPDENLDLLCEKIDLTGVSRERIEDEFNKLFLKSNQPSLGILWLKKINRLKEVLPEVYNLIGVPQSKVYHPEGDVFVHTMQTLDIAANLKYDSEQDKFIIMWAILCHDLGKFNTTEKVNDSYRSYGHELTGVTLSENLLKKISENKGLLKKVKKLVRYHMMPGQLVRQDSKDAAYKRLAKKLEHENLSLELLAKLAYADLLGRKNLKNFNKENKDLLNNNKKLIDQFINKINNLKINKFPEPAVLTGKDLIDLNLAEPGKKMGDILAKAYKLQIENNILDKKEIIKKIFKNK